MPPVRPTQPEFVTLATVLVLLAACRTSEPTPPTPLDRFVISQEPNFRYEVVDTLAGDAYTAYVVQLTSGAWLTPNEVDAPVWTHWLTIVRPDSCRSDIGMLVISGGDRDDPAPTTADDYIVSIAQGSGSVVALLRNVPSQPLQFTGDDFGPRYEDEIISLAWRRFLEAGAKDEDALWLPRLPMTNAAVRAMDAIGAVTAGGSETPVTRFVVTGASKRGWTTWTTAAVDARVVGIAPMVIDLLNLVPSFEHHWQVYGFWAPAVTDYVDQDIMDWMGSVEFRRLVEAVEPYAFRDRLTMPKLILNATGDQFFLPDSWQFYLSDLIGEKHLRYIPNTDHSLRGSDVLETLTAFQRSIVNGEDRPDFSWSVEDGEIEITIDPQTPPSAITLWRAANPTARDFRLETIGEAWIGEPVPTTAEGVYRLSVPEPDSGWAAFFGELTFPTSGPFPLKFTTGVVVTPDSLPYPPFRPLEAQGEPIGAAEMEAVSH